MRIRRARATDLQAIHTLISTHVSAGVLLPRTVEEIRRALPDFLVAVEQANLAGCVALECYGNGLAEIRSLVVAPEFRGTGLGGKLLAAATKAARTRGISRLLAVTGTGEFFERHGFARVPGGMPAEKVARDCNRCPKAANCRLAALALELRPAAAAPEALPILPPAAMRRLPGAAPA